MKIYRLLLITLLVMSLAACSQPATVPTTPTTGPVAVATTAHTDCPEATANTETFSNDTHGFCVLIPTGYSVLYPNPNEIILQRSSALHPDENQARVYIFVADAKGRSVADLADQLSAGAEQFGVTRTSTRLGGEEALILNHLPGQDVNRQVLVIHDGRSYQLSFVPLESNQPGTVAEVEALYTLMTETFSFGPQGS